MFIQYEKNGVNCILNLGHVSAVQHEKGTNKITLLGGFVVKGEDDGKEILGEFIIDEITFQDYEVFDGVITGEERAAKFMSKISGKVNSIEEQAVVPQRTTPKPPPPPPPRPQSEPESIPDNGTISKAYSVVMLLMFLAVCGILSYAGIVELISKYWK